MNEEESTAVSEERPSIAGESPHATESSPESIAGWSPPPEKKSTAMAWVALGVALFGFLLAVIPFATWGSGLFILAGLILSIIALVKVQAAKGASITALIVSVIAIPATIVMTIISIGFLAVAQTSLDRALIEQQITDGIKSQIDIAATVTCPDVMTGAVGSVFQCTAVDGNGDSVVVDVTLTDNAGGATWRIRN